MIESVSGKSGQNYLELQKVNEENDLKQARFDKTYKKELKNL
jgi:hypothetical protein